MYDDHITQEYETNHKLPLNPLISAKIAEKNTSFTNINDGLPVSFQMSDHDL